MDSSQLLLYFNTTLVMTWLALYTTAKSRRAKQWLVASLALGFIILPIASIAISIDLFEPYTLLPRPFNLIEIGILSSLIWSISATAYISRIQGKITKPVSIAIHRVVIIYAILLLSIGAAIIFNIQLHAPFILLLGLSGLILSLNLRWLSISSLATAAIFSIVALIISLVVPNIFTHTSITTIYNKSAMLSLYDIALLFFLSFSALPISQWWFKQPLKVTNNPNHSA